jgi:rRNA-processing protein FCF1
MDITQILKGKGQYNGVLIDTNLFLLFLVGIYDEKQISSFSKINKYTVEDFEVLLRILDSFPNKIYITPHILTEVCNIAGNYNTRRNYELFKLIEKLVINYNEEALGSAKLINNDGKAFYKFGLADSSIINLAKQNTLIITDDAGLYHMISSQNLPAINFTYLMDLID